MGDWSRGMILVSGTRGPGFNSRIAPYFFHNHMTNRSEESFDSEAITQLRLELFRMRQKAENQEKIVKMADFYRKVLTQLLDVLSDRWQAIQDIANILGIKPNSERIHYDLKVLQNEKQGERVVLSKLQKLNSELKAQEDLLSLINKKFEKIVKENQEVTSKYQKISKQHEVCGRVNSIAGQNAQKLRQFERIIQQKDASIIQLKKNNKSLQEQLHITAKKNEENTKKLENIEKEMDLKSREMEQNREIIQSATEASKQKQRILDNCQKLLQIISVPQDDYLKHHFKANGLVLEPQRQQKNKYSIVFDN